MQIVLASTSVSRREMLKNLGLEFTTVSPAVDEDKLKVANPLPAEHLVVRLGYEKAASLKSHFPSAVIIGSDQMVVCDGKILGKGHDFVTTFRQLQFLSGKTHQLLTSLVVITPQKIFRHCDTLHVTLRQLSDQTIRDYIECDQPFDCAGSYKFERAGISLVQRFEGQDPSAVLGLPLMALTNIFVELNLGLPFQKRIEKRTV
jgi:MAF protein